MMKTSTLMWKAQNENYADGLDEDGDASDTRSDVIALRNQRQQDAEESAVVGIFRDLKTYADAAYCSGCILHECDLETFIDFSRKPDVGRTRGGYENFMERHRTDVHWMYHRCGGKEVSPSEEIFARFVFKRSGRCSPFCGPSAD
jgi:hypothetical protein